jgi:hypothetical protein
MDAPLVLEPLVRPPSSHVTGFTGWTTLLLFSVRRRPPSRRVVLPTFVVELHAWVGKEEKTASGSSLRVLAHLTGDGDELTSGRFGSAWVGRETSRVG